jgi:hypothetical protein
MEDVVTALSGQIMALLPQARPALGEARYAEMAGRTAQIRQEARRGVNAKTLVESKIWLDQALAELLGLVPRKPERPTA